MKVYDKGCPADGHYDDCPKLKELEQYKKALRLACEATGELNCFRCPIVDKPGDCDASCADTIQAYFLAEAEKAGDDDAE